MTTWQSYQRNVARESIIKPYLDVKIAAVGSTLPRNDS